MILEGENSLKIKGILDIRKIGCRFDYLLDYVNKPIMEWSWIPLSDISNLYDGLIKWFHHHHPSLPKPSSHATKSKTQNLPLPAPHDPLSVPPHFITPPNPEHSTYKPPPITTT